MNKNHRYILIGAPGVGKGTHAKMLCDAFKIPHISTGDIFRDNIKNNTPLGIKAREYAEKGLLVPDSLTNDLVADRLLKDDCKNGFLLDGFPRNVNQAEFLNSFLQKHNLNLRYAINFFASQELIISRLSGRRVCAKCGAVYHMKNNPPKDGKFCKCGGDAIIRKDDMPEVIKQRLEVYNQTASDLISYYKKNNLLFDVDANFEIQITGPKLISNLEK